jgi:hypothetical protein
MNDIDGTENRTQKRDMKMRRLAGRIADNSNHHSPKEFQGITYSLDIEASKVPAQSPVISKLFQLDAMPKHASRLAVVPAPGNRHAMPLIECTCTVGAVGKLCDDADCAAERSSDAPHRGAASASSRHGYTALA